MDQTSYELVACYSHTVPHARGRQRLYRESANDPPYLSRHQDCLRTSTIGFLAHHALCWRELEGRLLTWLRTFLSIRASIPHVNMTGSSSSRKGIDGAMITEQRSGGGTPRAPLDHALCWRELKGRLSTMLRNSLSIRVSKEHGLLAHGECRRRTSALPSS